MDTPVFQTSAETALLDEALSKAQAKIDTAIKDKENTHLHAKYADLTAVWNACRAALTEHGISVTQWPLHSTDGRLHLLTRLALKGQWMMGEFSMPVGAKADAHATVSAVTYAKRCGLAAAVGVVAQDEDDDGEQAVRVQRAIRLPREAPASLPSEPVVAPNGTQRITAEMITRLRAALTEHHQDPKVFGGYLKEQYGYQAWSHIERRHYDAIMALAEGGAVNA